MFSHACVKRDTLIRYLLDELYTYEEDHSDTLNPNQDSQLHLTTQVNSQPVITLADARQIFDSQAETHRLLTHQLHQLVGTGFRTASQAIERLGHTGLQPAFSIQTIPYNMPFAVPGVMVSHTDFIADFRADYCTYLATPRSSSIYPTKLTPRHPFPPKYYNYHQC